MSTARAHVLYAIFARGARVLLGGIFVDFFSDTRRHLQVNNYDDDDDERTNEAPKNSSIDQQSARIVYYL